MIDVQGLTKEYRIVKKKPGLSGAVKGLFSRDYTTNTAVNQVSFRIDQREMVGYIGANGAGKSTTIKMLCGILTPTAGEIRVNGIVPYGTAENRAVDRRHFRAAHAAVPGHCRSGIV
jgi:ABC-2 type transport system ATP-binding protein